MKSLILGWLLLIVSFASAQISIHDTLNIVPLSLRDQLVLDEKIDPSSYHLGPGDEILVFIDGIQPVSMNTQVLPDGSIFLPQMGVFHLKENETLVETSARLEGFVKQYVNARRVQVSLANIKRFKVKVAGNVQRPGFLVVTGSERITDVVIKAGLLESSSQRLVQIIRDDTTMTCDVEAFCRLGDVTDNPYVRQGDRIYVPAQDSEFNKISIHGAVNQQLSIEYRPGDTLKRLIDFALGFKPNADSARITVARFTSEGSDYENISLEFHEDLGFELEPDDRVMVYFKNDYKRKHTVEVVGEINIPGFYPITEGEATLREIIEQAGGPTGRASLANAQLIRTQVASRTGRDLARLREMAVAEMNEEEREYWKLLTRESQNLVAVNFARALDAERRWPVKLLDGDRIYIPRLTRTITVTGAVHNPGMQTLQHGGTFDRYLAAAGGFTKRARKSRIQIIKGRTGAWHYADSNIPIEEGDTIFVPEKPLYNRWSIFRNTVSVVAQLSTIAAVVYSLTR